MPRLRLGLVGTGRVARWRAALLKEHPEAVIVAVASSDPARAAAFAAEHGLAAETSVEALLARTDVDAVLVCNRNQHHARTVEEALSSGRHVSVDYPLALSAPDGERLLNLAAQRHLVLHVEHIDLLSPWFLALQSALPQVGTVRGLSWVDLSAKPPQPTDWTFDQDSGPTFFVHHAVPSRLVRLAGPAAWASASEAMDGLDESGRFRRRLTSAQVGFASGVLAHVWDGIGLGTPGPNHQLTVIGTEGSLLAENRQSVRLHQADTITDVPLPASPGLFSQDLNAFLARVLRSEPAYVDEQHVRHTLTLADTLTQSSARRGAGP